MQLRLHAECLNPKNEREKTIRKVIGIILLGILLMLQVIGEAVESKCITEFETYCQDVTPGDLAKAHQI